MKRRIMGEEPLADVSELTDNDDEDGLPQAEKDDEKDKFDPMMVEAEKILADYIHIAFAPKMTMQN